MDVSSFAAGKYYMSVAGTGKKVGSTTYYTDYGSLGAYTVSCQRQHVTAAEYASIRAAYPKFGLPAAWDSLNIVEILLECRDVCIPHAQLVNEIRRLA